MSYECKTLTPSQQGVAPVCMEWQEIEVSQPQSFLPELTAAQRDEVLVWMVSIFAVVYVVKRLRRFLGA